MFKRKKILKGFLIIIFSFLLLFNFKGIIVYSSETLLLIQESQKNETQLLYSNNSQEKVEEIKKIWERIPRFQEISSKIRDFWDYTILPRFQTHFQQEEKRNSWGKRIELFFRKQYEERKLIIQKEIKEEKRELTELTPTIIIEIWEKLKEIRPFIIRIWERLEYFYSLLRNLTE